MIRAKWVSRPYGPLAKKSDEEACFDREVGRCSGRRRRTLWTIWKTSTERVMTPAVPLWRVLRFKEEVEKAQGCLKRLSL
jgi:hypothetical protein